MIVRVVTYGARSLDDAQQWAERRASDLRAVQGVQSADFIQQEDPPRVGAVIHFRSLGDVERYKESGPYQTFVEEMKEEVIDPDQPIHDEVYELMDV